MGSMGGGFGGGFDMGSRGDRPKTESTGENHAQNGETPTPSGGAALALVGCVVVLLAAMLFAVKYRRR